ncbi:MAG: DNA-directed RNA polymerase subunit alpha C-terminal domain-containing protein [bacterium]|nr:DNA-directed RNA polymerase subunit alpha C-terminal domain-containing protein [bacterium]
MKLQPPKTMHSEKIEKLIASLKEELEQRLVPSWTQDGLLRQDERIKVSIAIETVPMVVVSAEKSEHFSQGGFCDDTPIDCLNLSPRAHNACNNHEIKTIGQLCQETPDNLKKFRNCGWCTIQEIQDALVRNGRSLSQVSTKKVYSSLSKRELDFVEIQPLNSTDWEKICSLPWKPYLRKTIDALRESCNEPACASEVLQTSKGYTDMGWNSLGRINMVFRKSGVHYRLCVVNRNSAAGPNKWMLQIGSLKKGWR